MDTLISILQSWSVVLFGSIFFKSLETLNAKVVSFLNVYYKRSNQKALQFWREVNSLKHEKPLKECFDIQARGPHKRETPGICPVCQMFNPALLYRYITPSFVGHSFRVEGETWYFFANSPLCILI